MRLIDADALKERLEQIRVMSGYWYELGINRGLEKADTAIDEMPTVDIKTEVAREIFAEIEKIIFLKHRFNENRAVVEMDFEELKKIRNKYIGGVGE